MTLSDVTEQSDHNKWKAWSSPATVHCRAPAALFSTSYLQLSRLILTLLGVFIFLRRFTLPVVVMVKNGHCEDPTCSSLSVQGQHYSYGDTDTKATFVLNTPLRNSTIKRAVFLLK